LVQRFQHQSGDWLGRQPERSSSKLPTFPNGANDIEPTGERSIQSRPKCDERPSQSAKLSIGEGDHARLACTIGPVSAEHMPKVVGVADAAPESRRRILTGFLGWGLTDEADLNQPFRR
jgi:hypothetical protein